MTEGFWINYAKYPPLVVEVPDHELWVKSGANYRKIGIPEKVADKMFRFTTRTERAETLVFLLKHVPLIRARGHGADITFEFYARNPADALWAIQSFASKHAGAMSALNIYNLATNKVVSTSKRELHRGLEDEGPEAFLRAASRRFSREGRAMVRELLRSARALLADRR